MKRGGTIGKNGVAQILSHVCDKSKITPPYTQCDVFAGAVNGLRFLA